MLTKLSRRTRTGLLSLYLVLSLTACASGSAVVEFVPCVHPAVDAKTAGGLAKGLLDYADAVDLCNAMNGHLPIPNR